MAKQTTTRTAFEKLLHEAGFGYLLQSSKEEEAKKPARCVIVVNSRGEAQVTGTLHPFAA